MGSGPILVLFKVNIYFMTKGVQGPECENWISVRRASFEDPGVVRFPTGK